MNKTTTTTTTSTNIPKLDTSTLFTSVVPFYNKDFFQIFAKFD